MTADDWQTRARTLYERAVFDGDVSAADLADRELDRVDADLELARGRILHARFLVDNVERPDELAHFERALDLCRRLGDVRGEAEALFWSATFHQVVRHDDATAVPMLDRSCALARQVGDLLTVSYALRHLAIAGHRSGELAAARARLEQSLLIRRELGFDAGAAANLVGLAYIAADEGQHDRARALAQEALTLAEQAGAAAVARQAEQALSEL